MISVDETANVGIDDETPVTDAYQAPHGRFTGVIRSVRIDLD